MKALAPRAEVRAQFQPVVVVKIIAAYTHPPAPGEAQAADPRPGHYYVSVQDQGRRALLAGPFPTHSEALAEVPRVRALAVEIDPRGAWYEYGTARMAETAFKYGLFPPGSLNGRLGLSFPAATGVK